MAATEPNDACAVGRSSSPRPQGEPVIVRARASGRWIDLEAPSEFRRFQRNGLAIVCVVLSDFLLSTHVTVWVSDSWTGVRAEGMRRHDIFRL